METIFIKLFNMGMTATWVVLAVVLVRGLCKRAPKAFAVALWALVGVRLVCPVLAESVLSLIPSAEIVSSNILVTKSPTIYTGVAALNSAVNPVISEQLAPTSTETVTPMQAIALVAMVVWIAGMVVMFFYSLISYIGLCRSVKVSLYYRDNVYLCDAIATPFVFGVIRPRIYLPSGMEKSQMAYVIAHEEAHIKRKDHLWKPFGFFLLSVYWFNPVLWLAYVLFARDIELACDEKVIKEMDSNAKKGYAEALVACSMQKRMMFACPLAFGEVGVKNRVKSVRNYKKPALWIIILAVVAGVAVAVCFLTNPKPEKEQDVCVYFYNETTSENEVPYIVRSAGFEEDEREQFLSLLKKQKWVDDTSVDRLGHNYDGEITYEGTIYFGYEQKVMYYDHYFCEATEEILQLIRGLEVNAADTYFVYKGPATTAEEVKQRYPQYCNLNTAKGLEVYIWQLAENHYSCGVLYGTNRNKTNEELWSLKPVSIEEMRLILSTYDIPRSEIAIIPYSMPYSSYMYVIDEEYQKNLEAMFWEE